MCWLTRIHEYKHGHTGTKRKNTGMLSACLTSCQTLGLRLGLSLHTSVLNIVMGGFRNLRKGRPVPPFPSSPVPSVFPFLLPIIFELLLVFHYALFPAAKMRRIRTMSRTEMCYFSVRTKF